MKTYQQEVYRGMKQNFFIIPVAYVEPKANTGDFSTESLDTHRHF